LYTLMTSFLMVALGEMCDKSQFLALALAGRYPAGQVMLGVVLATALIQGIAVAVGTCLAEVIPLKAVSIVAGLSFLLFALWTLRCEGAGAEESKVSSYGSLLTIVLAFALAEMGDKTQLATVALAASFRQPVFVFLGATAGMVAADSIGVLVGDLLARRVSPRFIKMLSAGIFAVFGFLTLFRALGPSPASCVGLGVLALAMVVASGRLLRASRPGAPEAAPCRGGAARRRAEGESD